MAVNILPEQTEAGKYEFTKGHFAQGLNNEQEAEHGSHQNTAKMQKSGRQKCEL